MRKRTKKEKKYVIQRIKVNGKVVAEQILEIRYPVDNAFPAGISVQLLREEEKFLSQVVKVETEEISLYEVYKFQQKEEERKKNG